MPVRIVVVDDNLNYIIPVWSEAGPEISIIDRGPPTATPSDISHGFVPSRSLTRSSPSQPPAPNLSPPTTNSHRSSTTPIPPPQSPPLSTHNFIIPPNNFPLHAILSMTLSTPPQFHVNRLPPTTFHYSRRLSRSPSKFPKPNRNHPLAPLNPYLFTRFSNPHFLNLPLPLNSILPNQPPNCLAQPSPHYLGTHQPPPSPSAPIILPPTPSLEDVDSSEGESENDYKDTVEFGNLIGLDTIRNPSVESFVLMKVCKEWNCKSTYDAVSTTCVSEVEVPVVAELPSAEDPFHVGSVC